MTTIEEILGRLRELNAEQQREVLSFTERLLGRDEADPKHSRRNAKGALAHLGIQLDEDEIRSLRREAWKDFPREIER